MSYILKLNSCCGDIIIENDECTQILRAAKYAANKLAAYFAPLLGK